MRLLRTVSALLAALVLLAAPPLAADLDRRLSVQGRMDTAAGAPASGTFDLTVRLFPTDTGGTSVYTQALTGVVVAAGLFDAEIGPLPAGVLEAADSLWLEVQVGSDTLPRRPLRAVAYALVAQQARTALTSADLACSGCVAAAEVAFGYAASDTKGGDATGLSCTGCIGATQIAAGSVGTAQLAVGAVTAEKAAFNYAGANAVGGPAKDLACTRCVGSDDLATSLALVGDVGVEGSLTACQAGAPGCAVGVRDTKLTAAGDGWLTVGAPVGVQVRDTSGSAYRPLVFGGGTSVGNLEVTGALAASTAVVGGSVQVGGDAAACNQSKAGAIRWVAGSLEFQGCNGANWVRLDNAPQPIVTGITPSSSPLAGGPTITLTGANFAAGATVAFGGLASPNVTFVNSSTLTAVAPPAAVTGAVAIVVTNPDGSGGGTTGFIYYAPPAVYAGSLSEGVGLRYQYSPLSAGFLKANWAPQPWVSGYVVQVGTSPGGSNVVGPTNVGSQTSFTASGLTLQGAWSGTSYYVTVAYQGPSGTVTSGTSGPLGIAEAVSWDGVATSGLLNTSSIGGYTANFPSGSNWTVFYGNHYFETVTIANGTTVRVQPFGLADSVPAGVSPSDSRVTSPKDGWLGIYANEITVAGVIDARGRGYGGGAGAGATNAGSGLGGSNGLSGNGGGGGSGNGAGGVGRGGGGGGANGSCGSGPKNGGAGGVFGGGGGGVSGFMCNSSTGAGHGGDAQSSGAGGNGSGDCGGAGGAADYKGGRSTPVNGSSHFGGGGGGGYGAGGGGGGCAGYGGGGGGTGGFPASAFIASNANNNKGGGPAGGLGGDASSSSVGMCGRAGGYNAAGTNTDTTTDASFRLGSGGGGGTTTNVTSDCCEGGGGGGAGGGAVRLIAANTLSVTGQVLAGGGAGGAGNSRTGGDADNGGGAGGGGGGIVLSGGTLAVTGTVRTLGGQDGYFVDCGNALTCPGTTRGGYGGDGDARSVNGGTVKLFYGAFSGTKPTTASAGRVHDAGAGSAL